MLIRDWISDVGSSDLLLAYAIGAGIPMLAIAYGGKAIAGHLGWVARHTHRLQQGFGLLLVLTALAIYFQYDILAYAWIANLFQIGRAWCRERVCQSVSFSVVAASFKKKKKQYQ